MVISTMANGKMVFAMVSGFWNFPTNPNMKGDGLIILWWAQEYSHLRMEADTGESGKKTDLTLSRIPQRRNLVKGKQRKIKKTLIDKAFLVSLMKIVMIIYI